MAGTSTSGRRLLRERIYDEICQLIVRDSVQVGERIPTEAKLGQLFGVNHQTVRAALQILQEDGYIMRRRGSGSYLCKPISPKAVSSPEVAIVTGGDGHLRRGIEGLLAVAFDRQGLEPTLLAASTDAEREHAARRVRRMLATGCRRMVIGTELVELSSEIEVELPFANWFSEPHLRVTWVAPATYTLRPGIPGDVVACDFEQAMDDIIGQLLACGHRRIAYMTHRLKKWHRLSRYGGFARACLFERCMFERDLLEQSVIVEQLPDRERHCQQLLSLLTSADRPTAFIADQDFRAVALYEALGIAGLRVPDDVVIVGHHNTPWAEQYDMTSVAPDIEAMVGEIVDLMNQPPTNHRRAIFVQPRIMYRGSFPQSVNGPSDAMLPQH